MMTNPPPYFVGYKESNDRIIYEQRIRREFGGSDITEIVWGKTGDISVEVAGVLVRDEWRCENSWPYHDSNSNPSVVQPVASWYTDCDTKTLPRRRWANNIKMGLREGGVVWTVLIWLRIGTSEGLLWTRSQILLNSCRTGGFSRRAKINIIRLT
jgi:hypothetical protein